MKVWILLLAAITSCGTYDSLEAKRKKKEDSTDQSIDALVEKAGKNILSQYASYVDLVILSTDSSFKVNRNRCIPDTICSTLADAQDVRTELIDTLISTRIAIEDAPNEHEALEEVRKREVILLNLSSIYINIIKTMPARLAHPSSTDIFQFGAELQAITNNVQKNSQAAAVLSGDLRVVEVLFNYIYPSDRYDNLIMVKNPLQETSQ